VCFWPVVRHRGPGCVMRTPPRGGDSLSRVVTLGDQEDPGKASVGLTSENSRASPWGSAMASLHSAQGCTSEGAPPFLNVAGMDRNHPSTEHACGNSLLLCGDHGYPAQRRLGAWPPAPCGQNGPGPVTVELEQSDAPHLHDQARSRCPSEPALRLGLQPAPGCPSLATWLGSLAIPLPL
jgi:hypothetical protein